QVFCSPGISSRELFGPIRGVCKNWLSAVDNMPCAAARRKVALVCAGQTGGGGDGGGGDGGRGGGGEGGCGGGGSGNEGAICGDGVDRVDPREGLAGGGRGGGRGGGGGVAGSGAALLGRGGGRRGRMLDHLAATRVLCSEWGGGSGGGDRGRGGGGGGSGNSSGGGGGGGSWGGWEAFALAVATSSSQDRLPLCCWAVRPLMAQNRLGTTTTTTTTPIGNTVIREGGSGAPSCPGLPRGEVIELLCLMLCALRSLEGGGDRRGGGGGGSGNAWQGRAQGSARLKGDLLVCARVLENWDVR
ncbi:unnamed protein product, partial [Laminaria digitata]